MASIADILIAKGNAAAAGAQNRGNIYADLIRNLSSMPGQAVQQARADEMTRAQQQLLQQRMGLQSQELDLGRQKLAAGDRQQREADVLDKVWADPDIYMPDGTINKAGLQQRLSAAGAGHLAPHVFEIADALDSSRTKLDQQRQALSESYRETRGKDALQLERAGNDPGAFHLIVADRAKSGVISPEQAKSYLDADTPEAVAAITAQWKAGSTSGKPKLRDVAPGTSVIDENSPDKGAVFTAPQKDEPPSAASFAAIANDPKRPPPERAAAKAALDALQTTPASTEDARHNKALEDIAKMTAGRQEAAQKETERHDRVIEDSARNAKTARPMLSSDAGKVADFDTSLSQVKSLRDAAKSTGAVSQIESAMPNFVTEFTGGIGEAAKSRNAQISLVRQIIGKTLEGGVLRKEDEIKYKTILPTIGDSPDVAAKKLDGLESLIKEKRSNLLESLGDAGFNVDKMTTRAPVAPPAPAAPAAPTLTPGLQRLGARP